jgi:hypothetical protein
MLAAAFVAVCCLQPPVVAQEGGTGHGDVFGDLVHIKRDPSTGQPILQKRLIEYPQDLVDWGYCPIPIDDAGLEIPFAPLSCDADPAALDRLVEVDYFGRLSGGRTKERNLRMHFDETINGIRDAEAVDREPGGRLRLGTACTPDGACATWRVIDSPFENLALYHRLMKYGHLQTDPAEVDTFAQGDPAQGTIYHPALRAQDWAKFRGTLTALLPRASSSECFSGGTFVAACAAPQSLTAEDFVRAASFLGGAADKHGKITVDLVQYMNRVLRITQDTPESLANVDTLPVLIRDDNGVVAPAPPGLPAPADERFVDFSRASYFRNDQFSQTVRALVAAGVDLWRTEPAVSLLPFLGAVNGEMPTAAQSLLAFLRNASDALRAVEFIHNYEPPEDIGGVTAATTTAVTPRTAAFSYNAQAIALQASVSSSTAVNGGTVTFTVQTALGVAVGSAAVSATIVNGAASAEFTLPGGVEPQVLTVTGAYSGATGFAPSTGLSTLTVTLTPTATVVNAASAPPSGVDQTVALAATVSAPNASPISEGTVTFTVTTANGTAGTPVVAPVVNNLAQAAYLLPGGLAAQTLTVMGAFSGTSHFLSSSGSSTLTFSCPSMQILPASLPLATVGRLYTQTFTTDPVATVTYAMTGPPPPGLTFSASGTLTGTPTTAGVFPFTLGATDSVSCTTSKTYELTVTAPPTLVTGPGIGMSPRVRTFSPDGTPATGPAADFLAYSPSFEGGVRVATADVTGDGIADVMTGAGPSGGPHVTVVDGVTGALVHSFMAFPEASAGGIYVASGDVDNDGSADLIVSQGSGAPQVRVFSGRSGQLLREFFAFDLAFQGGVRVGAGDVNGDGYADIIVGGGPGGGPNVRVFNGVTGAEMASFLAYDPRFLGGVFVAGADVTGDGRADIVTGADQGGGPHVRVWNLATGTEVWSAMAFDPAFTGGVRVAGTDLNGDGRAEVIAGAGLGGSSLVRIFDVSAGVQLGEFAAYDVSFSMGVYVAGRPPSPVR